MSACCSKLNVAVRKMDDLNKRELYQNQRKKKTKQNYDYGLNLEMKLGWILIP